MPVMFGLLIIGLSGMLGWTMRRGITTAFNKWQTDKSHDNAVNLERWCAVALFVIVLIGCTCYEFYALYVSAGGM